MEAKVNLKKINQPDKLKTIASANGETGTKYLTGNDLGSNTATVLFEFKEKNYIIPVGGGMSI